MYFIGFGTYCTFYIPSQVSSVYLWCCFFCAELQWGREKQEKAWPFRYCDYNYIEASLLKIL